MENFFTFSYLKISENLLKQVTSQQLLTKSGSNMKVSKFIEKIIS